MSKVKYSISALMARWFLPKHLARKKHKILVAHQRAVTRGDTAKASVWARNNLSFDLKHLRPRRYFIPAFTEVDITGTPLMREGSQ